MEQKKVLARVKKYLQEIEYGKIEIVVHQGKAKYIEKSEKEKLDDNEL